MSTWFITGCSTGLGRHLAESLLDTGHNVVVTARDAAKVADLVTEHPDTALAASLDVTDVAQIDAVVADATARFGAIDVLVNNAGYGYRAAVEEGEDEAVQHLFSTHFHGPVSMIKAVLPGMRARRTGTIVNISSISAQISPPGSGYYSAVKAALEALSSSLQKELAPLGIHVAVVEPGAFRTDFAGRSLIQTPREISDYADTSGRRRKENDPTHGTQAGDPDKFARALTDAVESEDPPALLLMGSDSLSAYRSILEARREMVEKWAAVSVSTDRIG